MCWRFGVDLTERLRRRFLTRLLVTADLHRRVCTRDAGWPDQIYPEFDAVGIIGALDPADLAVAATDTAPSRTFPTTLTANATVPEHVLGSWAGRVRPLGRR